MKKYENHLMLFKYIVIIWVYIKNIEKMAFKRLKNFKKIVYSDII